MEKLKLIKISLIITDILLGVLAVCTVALPWAVTWYVETMGRSKTLAATIFVTCYPCVPFAAVSMLSLRKLLKLTRGGKLFCKESIKIMKKISVCSIVMSVITLIAGKFYLPFLIMGAALMFSALLIFAFRSVMVYETAVRSEKDTSRSENQEE